MAEPSALGATTSTLVFLGAAVAAVPLLRFAGLSAVLGYLVAGVKLINNQYEIINQLSETEGSWFAVYTKYKCEKYVSEHFKSEKFWLMCQLLLGPENMKGKLSVMMFHL